MPLAVYVAGIIVVIISVELHREVREGNPVRFLGVAIGLFNLPYQA